MTTQRQGTDEVEDAGTMWEFLFFAVITGGWRCVARTR